MQSGPTEEIIKFLQQSILVGKSETRDETLEAKDALESLHSIIGRIYLLLRIRRDFFFGLAELLRLRITPAIGYQRIQSESLGLLSLFQKEPRVAQAWLDIIGDKSGKSFYKEYHRRVRAEINLLGFGEYYEQGSEMSLHSRFGGIGFGLLQAHRQIVMSESRTVGLVYQEVSDSVVLFLWFCSYLRFHQRLVVQIRGTLPEIDDSQFNSGEIDEFSSMLDRLINKLIPMYKEIRERGVLGIPVE
jgi:hypothetical protein